MGSDITLQKVPPHSVEFEQAVLGAVLLDSHAINTVSELIMPENFYMESHSSIYISMLELSAEATPIDLMTLKDKLEKNGTLEQVGGIEYLAELAEKVPTASNAGYYAKLVREKSILRRMIRVNMDIIADGYQEPADVEEFIDTAEKQIFEVTQDKLEKPYVTVKEIVNEAFKRIEDLDARDDSVSGIPTGFSELDKYTSGFQSGDLVIIAARPAMGKTSLALNIAVNCALEAGKTAAVFSLEMSRQELVIRMLCSVAKVDSNKFRVGRLGDDEWMRLVAAADKLSHANILIDDTAALKEMELRAKARRMKAGHGLDILFVDYLQLMRASGMNKNAPREQEISQISRSLKALAKELQIPVIALSQLNRDLEKRQDKRPQMSDLRESGAIEQDADVILFIYRDVVYNPENIESENAAELIISKQRSGPTGRLDLAYLREYTLFENAASSDMEAYIPPDIDEM